MNYTRGDWKEYQDALTNDAYNIEVKHTGHEKVYTEIAVVYHSQDARLIVSAVNACVSVNPDNPQTVAESIKDMYEALKAIYQDVDLQNIDGGSDELNILTQKALAKAEGK